MRKLYVSFLSIAIFTLVSVSASSQFVCDGITYFCMFNGTIETCSGNFVDDGASNPYSDTPYTMTICPDTPGQVVQLDFVAFNLQTSANPNNSDYLEFFDGDNTSFTSLGSFTSDDFQNNSVTATINNITGCLTIVFDPNGAANTLSPGWQATITCTTPCANPTSHAIISDPDPLDPNVQTVSICLDVPVTFSDNGSFAEPGFVIEDYIWDFDNGDFGNGQNVTYTFTEPGEYVVSLTVEDDNDADGSGCQNLNFEPLQVLVSTIPEFPGIAALDTGPFYTCTETVIGIDANSVSNESGSIDEDLVYPTWTALPPQVVSGTSYLADGAGFSYTTSLEFDFFEAGATLDNCDDLLNIFVNMEHSYMGDLNIFVTCPDGTSVSLLDFPNNGGSLFIGGAIDVDDPNVVGEGYDYVFDNSATETWDEWVTANGYTYGESLPGGTYEPESDFCDLVGCPLNGEWTFNVTDNQGIDDGFIFFWGIAFDPDLYPGITTFTPTAGSGADSTYWTGPYMTTDANGDMMTIDPPAGAGSYDYTYTVINSFGCVFDTTITLSFQDAIGITAGPDQWVDCGDIQLQGGYENQPAPSCSDDGGIFTYCYPDNDNFTWTFCPDSPGDGVTFMTFAFISGQAEGCCDFITVYDGDNTSAPVIASGVTGILDGMSWTATNPTGCITIWFGADFSVSCGAGFYSEWEYEVSCTNGGPQYTWEWTPTDYLDNPSIPMPTVSGIQQQTTYTLTAYPTGFPDCAMTDETTVFIDPLADPGLDATVALCSTDPPISLFAQLGGSPASGGTWSAPNGTNLPDDVFDPATDLPGTYTYTISFGLCELISEVEVEMALPVEIEAPDDSTMCFGTTVNLYLVDLDEGLAPFQYNWSFDGAAISSAPVDEFTPVISGTICVDVTDACGYVATDCFDVEVEPVVEVVFEADTTMGCLPTMIEFTNLVDPALYLHQYWSISNGATANDVSPYSYNFTEPGTYDVALQLVSDLGCEYEVTYTDYITIFTPPVADWNATPQPTDALETEITFTDLSTGDVVEWYWEFDPNGLFYTSTEQNPVIEFPMGVGGIYPVSLLVTDINNCTDIFIFEVDINDIFNVFIPNTFTPNGDGINDVFFVSGSDIDVTEFSLQVFNRWGDVIYESADPAKAWTGSNDNGDYFVQDGIYVWFVVANSMSTTEKKELTGTVQIMR